MELWRILVPSSKPESAPGRKRFFSLKHHKEWDKKVVSISGGLTVLKPVVGYWLDCGKTMREKMIPVEIACSRRQIEAIMSFTAKHYSQKAVFAAKVSGEVLIRDF